MDLKEEDILRENIHTHWYYVAKGRAMRKFLTGIKAAEVLDVGAGSGIFSKQLLDHDICDSATCIDLNYPKEWSETHNGRPIQYITSQKETSQQLVIIMDVLEHVENDFELLNSYVATMKKGSYVFITVPAFQFLWSGHDIFLEHYRRYTISMLEAVAKKTGLTSVRSRYFFGALFPAIAFIRLLNKLFSSKDRDKAQSDLKIYPNWLNSSLTTICNIEEHSLFKFNRLFGLSVFGLYRKD